MKTIIAALLTIILLFTGCQATNGTLTAKNTAGATVAAVDYAEPDGSYETVTVEITDAEVLNELWGIIEAQQQCEPIDGDNCLSVCPKLVLTYPDGKEVTMSYTWCGEEYGTDPLDGAPFVNMTGECFLISGDGITRRYAVKDRETENRFRELLSEQAANAQPAKADENDVLLVLHHTNYAWEKQDNGWVIDRAGNLYGFDIASHDYLQTEFLGLMRELIETNEPKQYGVLSESKLADITEQIEKIDASAGYSERSAARDMGQYSLYALRGEELILLRSTGDWEKEPNDPAAREICRIYDERNNTETASGFFGKLFNGLREIFE
ncbi:MAG: hypothetical protein ACI4XA_01395 [Oscillospiraceae bacterium]